MMTTMRRSPLLAAAFAVLAFTGVARAEQIVVSNYGIAANGMPYAIAMAKGFFNRREPMSRASSPPTAAAPPSET